MFANHISRKECVLALALIATASLSSSVKAEPGGVALDWTWGPMLPRACSAFGSCQIADGAITVGGTFWSGAEGAPPEKHWMADVYRLPPGADSWIRLPDYPAVIGQPLLVCVDDAVYVIGGRSKDAAYAGTSRLSTNEANAAWRRGPDLPRPLFGLVGGVDGDVIYAVTDRYATIDGSASAIDESATVLAWNTAAKNSGWTRVSHAPDPEVGYRAAEIVGGKLYLFGGAVLGDDKNLQLRDTVWSFDLQTKTWTGCAALPYPLRDASAVGLDGRSILITGGVEEAASPEDSTDGQPRIILSNRCLLYDADTDQFSLAEPLRLAVADHGLVVRDSEVLVIAGEDSPYRTRTDLVQRGNAAGVLRKTVNHLEH